MVTWSMAKQRATGHFDCVGILVRIRVRAAVPLRPSLLRSRGRDGLSPPPPVLAVVRLAAAVVLPVLVPPRVDEAAVVPLAAVALQEVLAGARLVLGVVVLGHPPALAMAAPHRHLRRRHGGVERRGNPLQLPGRAVGGRRSLGGRRLLRLRGGAGMPVSTLWRRTVAGVSRMRAGWGSVASEGNPL